jgi:ligand-binding sensor domain-containing protein
MTDGGVLRYAQGRFSEVAAGLASSLVTAMHADRQGRIWIASSQSGIAIVNPSAAQLQFKNLTISEGLASNNIRSLAEDSRATFTPAPPVELTGFLRIWTRVTHYSIANGLAGDFIISAFRDSRGTLWFGTPSGLSRLVPEQRTGEAPPPIQLSGLRIAGESRPIAELGSTLISNLELGAWPEQSADRFLCY